MEKTSVCGARVIVGQDCLAEGAAHLVAVEPRFGPALAACGALPLRQRPQGFGALREAIVSQQVSVAAATAIGARLDAAGFDRAEAVRGASDEALRDCGLSRPKVRYVRALAEAELPYDQLPDLPTAEVIATLTAVSGIGPWTAQIYCLFSLMRADVFAPADLALQESARILLALDERPTAKALEALAAPWAPWRGVAARALWAYYRIAKGREGIT